VLLVLLLLVEGTLIAGLVGPELKVEGCKGGGAAELLLVGRKLSVPAVVVPVVAVLRLPVGAPIEPRV
jgi:hypothetical protein